MTDAPQISLILEDSKELMALLDRVRPILLPNEAGLVRRLFENVPPQLAHAQEVLDQIKDKEVYSAHVDAIAKKVLDVLPVIKRHGLTEGAVVYINAVSNIFMAIGKDLSPSTQNYLRTGDKTDPIDHQSSYMLKTLKKPHQKLDIATAKYMASDLTKLVASENYTLAPARQKLAQKCLRSGISQGEDAGDWISLEMVTAHFHAMMTHVNLAKALILGVSRNIEQVAGQIHYEDYLDKAVIGFLNVLDSVEKVKSPSPRR